MGFDKKVENLNRRWKGNDYLRAWGTNAFLESTKAGGGGLKYGSRPWYGMGIF